MIRPIYDTGFADRELLRPLLRRIRVREGIADARRSIEALANLLNQHCEPLGRDRARLEEQSVGLSCGDEQGVLGRFAVNLREGNALREHELLQGIDLVAELLDRIEVGVRHGLFSCASDAEASRAGEPAHRLSGGAQ